MNCPNCGRPLEEGEVCNCINETEAPQSVAEEEIKAEAAEPQAPVQEEAPQPEYIPPQQTYYAPVPPVPPQQNPYQQYGYQQPYGAPAPVMPVPARRDYPEGYKPKRKYVAVILAATLGSLGVHNFYLGNKNKGLTQLLICLIGSLFFGLGMVAAEVWAIVDAVDLLTEKQDADANGFKIQTFEEALVAERIRAEKEEKEKE